MNSFGFYIKLTRYILVSNDNIPALMLELTQSVLTCINNVSRRITSCFYELLGWSSPGTCVIYTTKMYKFNFITLPNPLDVFQNTMWEKTYSARHYDDPMKTIMSPLYLIYGDLSNIIIISAESLDKAKWQSYRRFYFAPKWFCNLLFMITYN